MKKIYYSWQEDGYYGEVTNDNIEKSNNMAFANNTNNVEVKTRKRISFKTYALFALTASMVSTLTVIGTWCLST